MADANIETPPKRVYVKTFGCQMNVYDSGKMRALLAQDGFAPTADMSEADLVIVNTCSVREKPEQKLHSFLGVAFREKRRNATARPMTVAVAGCVAQQEGRKLLKRYKELDLVFGPDAVPRIVSLVSESQQAPVLDTEFLDAEDYVFASDLDPEQAARISAFVTIQKGCDNKCTFCIVPATRGPELSRPSEQILQEVRDLVSRGVKEVTLLGQNVNSYGLKVPGERTFAQLLYAVAGVSGVERIRYTTSHPRDMGPDVVQAYRDLPQLASGLHLPVQSGASRVLRRMKRFYTREDYLRLVDDLRSARPDLALTTDIIVGFPGETDADFAETMSLLEAVRFHSAFSFCYSPRPGTSALRLLQRNQEVPMAVSKQRLAVYQARQRTISLALNRSLEGEVVDVLVEGSSRHGEGVMCGRTGSYKTVNFPGPPDLVGQTVRVQLTRAFTNSFRGEQVFPGQQLRSLQEIAGHR
jgi:tRNA-2-methylthio-N6-dimethylallyladenosine synthase